MAGLCWIAGGSKSECSPAMRLKADFGTHSLIRRRGNPVEIKDYSLLFAQHRTIEYKI